MTKKATTHTLHIVLKLPRKIGDFIIAAQHIHDTMAANAKTLPSPNPALTALQTHIDDLTAKATAAKARTTGAVDDRNTAQKLVAADLNNERAYVEQIANGDPENADNIAKDAGMTVRKFTAHAKPPLAVKHGTVSGQVHLVAKATKGAKGNLWQYSTDGGKTWVDAPQTTKASTTVQGLTPGVTVTARQRVFTKAGVGDWGQPVSLLVI